MNERERLRSDILGYDREHVWHPYTPEARAHSDAPLVIHEAFGSTLVDMDGKQYIDGNSSWWVSTLGHRHPRLIKVLKEQADRLPHVAFAGITHEPGAMLATELIRAAPRTDCSPTLNKVFYTDNGSTAVEAAIKVAAQFWYQNDEPQRTHFITLDGAFHGDTMGATSVGGVELFRRPFGPYVFDCLRVPFPDPEREARVQPFDRAFEAIEAILCTRPKEIAGVLVEPMVQGTMGMRMHHASFLKELRKLCSKAGTLLIFDEVFSGYGRTGPMWASEHASVTPDILCLGKAFASILPMGAILVSKDIYEGFCGDEERTFFYGHTFCGHPLGAAVAREVLAIYRDDEIVRKAQPKARRISKAIKALGELPGVRRPRSLGMIGAVDLGSAAYQGKAGWRVYAEALKRGAYLRPLGDTVYVCPALNIDDAELDRLLEIMSESIRAAALPSFY